MKIKLINPKTGAEMQSKYNGKYHVKRKETSVVKTVFYEDGAFCRGATYTAHVIDDGKVYSVERVKEDNFDGNGKIKYFLNVIGQKYNSYLYKKPCIIVGVKN